MQIDADTNDKKSFLNLNILRDIIIIVFVGVTTWKLVSSNLNIDLSSFNFTDLLALILALFSVSLSVAFYFKATETSNRFYENSYNFTKDMSEVLGRIEAGFGEKLRHLDEGYSGIRDRFDKFPPYANGVTHDEKVDKEEQVVERERELHEIIDNLANRAQLADEEKTKLFDQLAEKDSELEVARRELRRLNRYSSENSQNEKRIASLISYIAKMITNYSVHANGATVSVHGVMRIFIHLRDDLDTEAQKDLMRYGLLDSDGGLTREAAIKILRKLRELQPQNEKSD